MLKTWIRFQYILFEMESLGIHTTVYKGPRKSNLVVWILYSIAPSYHQVDVQGHLSVKVPMHFFIFLFLSDFQDWIIIKVRQRRLKREIRNKVSLVFCEI